VTFVSRSLYRLAFIGTMVAALFVGPAAARAQATVQVGDRIVFRMLLNSEPFRDTLDVNDSGFVVFPRVGAVKLGGHAVAGVHDLVQRRFAEDFKDPIDVQVLKPVTVLGSVRDAKVFYVNSTMTVRDVVAMAKGLDDFGDRKKVSLVRGGQTTLLPDWDQSTTRLELQSGDAVVVGRRSWVSVNGVQLGSLALSFLSIVITLSK
jgi:protein involved in polysaccharide export with SLBB domain